MKDVSNFPVRPNKCSTCPFLIENGKRRDPELASRLEIQMLAQGIQHICRHESLEGKKSSYICRGAQDYVDEIQGRLELMKSATDNQ